MATIDYNELELAFDFVSSGSLFDATAYISRESGEILWQSFELENRLPKNLDDSALYAEIPSKSELKLGKALALHFASEHLNESFSIVEDMFNKRGAYSRFKVFLESKEILDRWYEYEQVSIKAALCGWAESEGFTVTS